MPRLTRAARLALSVFVTTTMLPSLPAVAQERERDQFMEGAAAAFVNELGEGPGQWFNDHVAQTSPIFNERGGLGGPRGTFVEREQRLLRYSISSSLCMVNGRTHILARGEADVQIWAQLYDGDDGWLRNSVYNEDKKRNVNYRIFLPVHLDWGSTRVEIDNGGPVNVVARGAVNDLWDTWEAQIQQTMVRAAPLRVSLDGSAQMYAVTRKDEWREAFKRALPAC